MADTTENPSFMIERIYTKDVSFESPSTPKIFLSDWQPEVNLDLQTKHSALKDGRHEVVLHVTATVKTQNEVAFLAEVHQAGIFSFQNFPDEQLHHGLGCKCPEILFPYARARVAELVMNGGFPQLNLAPINFEALYLQHLKKQQEENDSSSMN